MEHKIGDKVLADWEDGEGIILKIEDTRYQLESGNKGGCLIYQVKFPHGVKTVFEGELKLANDGKLF